MYLGEVACRKESSNRQATVIVGSGAPAAKQKSMTFVSFFACYFDLVLRVAAERPWPHSTR